MFSTQLGFFNNDLNLKLNFKAAFAVAVFTGVAAELGTLQLSNPIPLITRIPLITALSLTAAFFVIYGDNFINESEELNSLSFK